MNNKELFAIIAEGNTERAIIDLLLDHHALKFEREDILQEEIIRCREAKKFAKEFLNKSFNKKICIYRILDSKNEKFNLPRVYLRKISRIVNLRTRPEIEILFIIQHGDYEKYTNRSKSSQKPSEYVKQNYSDLKKVKAYQDNYDYWNEHFYDLINCLKQYKKYHPKEDCIADILKGA